MSVINAYVGVSHNDLAAVTPQLAVIINQFPCVTIVIISASNWKLKETENQRELGEMAGIDDVL